MTLIVALAVMAGLAVVLLALEVALPTGGLLGVAGALAGVTAVVICFYLSAWLGAAVLVLCAVLALPVAEWVLKLSERSPIGRRLVLNEVAGTPVARTAGVGSVGVTLGALRPSGEADFDGTAYEVTSEFGPVDPRTRVRVVGHTGGGVAVVRAVQPEELHA